MTRAAGYDVIADCGRLTVLHPPVPVLAAADVVLLVLRRTLPSIRASATALAGLRRAGVDRVALVTVGEGDYTPAEVSNELGVRVVAMLPADPGTAAVLSAGGECARGRLLRVAARAEVTVRRLIDGRGVDGTGSAVRPAPAARVEPGEKAEHVR